MSSTVPIPHRRRLWLYLLVALILAFLVLPILIVIPTSFSSAERLVFPPPGWSTRWFQAYFTSHEWVTATLVSLRVAVVTTVVAVMAGTMTAYGLFRGEGAYRAPAYLLLLLPAVMPTIIIAVGVFLFFARFGLNNGMAGLVLAHTALALPFVVVLVTAGLQSCDFEQERAARSLGAGPLRAFVTAVLPQIRLSVLSSALMAFLTSFDEVIVAAFISSGTESTLTKKMFSTLRNEVNPMLSAVATLLIGVTVCVMLLAALGRKRTD